MACDAGLLDELFDDDLEEEEDWSSTSWADPECSTGQQPGQLLIKTGPHVAISDAESSIHSDTGQSTVEEKGDCRVIQRMLLNDNKAGMEGVDKERINQIIHEASKGSKFYENERQKEEQMKRRIEEQRHKIQQISAEQLRQGITEADRLLEDFEQQRDLSRTIVHIDMDAFYAAVEIRDDPSLKNKPMAVGGNSMLSTSNYHARKFGVRAAMPGFIARKLCPELVIVPTNFEKYTSVSKQVKSIMAEYDPNFCPMSLDEAYLDLTEHLENRKAMSVDERTFISRDATYSDSRAHCKCDLNEIARNYGSRTSLEDGQELKDYFSKTELRESVDQSDSILGGTVSCAKFGEQGVICPKCKKEFPPFRLVTFGMSDEEAVNELRARIEQKTTLTASAGIAPNMMLAKVCSDKNKPNGQYKITPTREDVMNFIRDLSTRKISGIGKVSEAMLNAVGVHTCTDLYEKRGLLYHLYSQISFNYFMRICIGIGSTTVERDSERKSMSTERTFSELSKPADLYQKCEELSRSLAEDLKSEQLKGKTVSIKIKTVKFEVRTRAQTVRDYTSDYTDILRSATELLKTEIQHCAPQPLRLRLMGVRMSNLLRESLCQGKKQNTIIGAFKLAAKPSRQETKHETARSNNLVELENVAGKTVNNSTTDFKEPIEVSDKDIKLDSDIQSTEWKSASDMIGDDVDGSTLTKAVGSVNESKAGNSEMNCGNFSKILDCSKDVTGIMESKGNKSDFEMKEEPELKADSEVLSTVKPIGEQREYDGKTDNTCNYTEGEKKVYIVVKEEKDAVGECSAQGIDNASVYSPNLRTTRSGVKRTPISWSKRNGRVGKIKGKEKQQPVAYACPVCALNILCENLQSFNEHVDMCLESGDCDRLRSPVKDISKVEGNKNSENEVDSLTCSLDIIEDSTHVSDVTMKSFKDTGNKSEAEAEIISQEVCNKERTAEQLMGENDKQSDQLHKKNIEGSDRVCKVDGFDLLNNRNSVSVSSDIEGVNKDASTNNQRKNAESAEAKTDFMHTAKLENENAESSIEAGNEPKNNHKEMDIENGNDVNITEQRDIDNGNSETEDKVIKDFNTNFTELKAPHTFEIESNSVLRCTTMDGMLTLADNSEIMDREKSRENIETQIQKIPLSSEIIIENSVENQKDSIPTIRDQSNEEIRLQINVISGLHKADPGSLEEERLKLLQVQKYGKKISDEIEEMTEEDAEDDGKDDVDCVQEGSLLVCPICNVEQRSVDLNEFNSHVDACLSKGTISQILQEQKKQEHSGLKRRRDLTPTSSKSMKMRKTTMPGSSKPCRSIASFFIGK